MPSVDVIRNITIKGKADGVDDATAALNRLTDSIKSANDNLARSNAAAQDNARGFSITGEGAATAANHLRQAAEAAYAFSPAFRGVVNEMAGPALGAANIALAGVAAGIVTATNYAGTGLIAVAGAAEKASPSLLAYATGVRSAGIAMEAFNPTVTSTAGSLLSFLAPALRLVGWFSLAVKGIEAVGEAWHLGGEKLAEYVALSEKASSMGLSTDFFQRITKAAEDAKQPVDALYESLKKIAGSTAGKLNGSDAGNAIDTLTKAGNFQGNSGVSQLQNANGTEEKLRALATLFDQAIAKGERLAALDLAKTIGGDKMADNLAKDSGYLDKMVEAADEIRAQDLVSAGTVANAVELQNRLDAAEKILSERWHPIQDLLTSLGIKMRETWVDIVEAIAKAVDAVFSLGQRIASALSPLLDYMHMAGDLIGKAAPFMALLPGGIGLPLAAATFSAGKILGTPNTTDADAAQRDALLADAKKRLAEGLNRKFDTSHSTKTQDEPDTAAYDRATESVLKYIETTKAASLAVSDAAGEQEKFKVIAQLTAAGIKDGLTPEAAKLKAEMSGLGQQAGAAADALAKAKQVSANDFGSKTALLSQEDVSIATQLKSIYGNDVPAALNSTYAAGIRLNNAFKDIGSAIETNLTQGLTDIVSGAKSAGQAFTDMGKAIVTAIEQMVIKIMIVEPLMRSLQGAIGGSGGFLSSLFGGGSALAGSTSSGTSLAAGTGGLPFPMFASGTDSAPGGWSIIGENGPELMNVPRGAQILPNGAAPSGTQVNVSVMNFGNDNVSVSQKQNGNGGVDLEVMVGQAAANQMAKKGSALRQVTDNRALLASR